MSKGIGGHTRPYRGRTDDWITPSWIIEGLGTFDLDPCSSVTQPWRTATKCYTIDDDGFNREWEGRVWLNPPYGPQTAKWLKRLSEHGRGTALTFARTETAMFFDWVWPRADAVLFIEKRLYFYYPDGQKARANSGGPSILIAYGKEDGEKLKQSGIPGAFFWNTNKET